MDLFYDELDDRYHETRGSQILYWLDDLGAKPFSEAAPADEGFLFAGYRSDADYRQLVAGCPLIRDRPEEREPLLRFDAVLDALQRAGVAVPTPLDVAAAARRPAPSRSHFPAVRADGDLVLETGRSIFPRRVTERTGIGGGLVTSRLGLGRLDPGP